MIPVTLPRSTEIDGVVHVECWRSQDLVILQNYSATTAPSDEPIAEPGGQIVGPTNLFHLYRIEHTPGEQLGIKLGEFSSLTEAMDYAFRVTA